MQSTDKKNKELNLIILSQLLIVKKTRYILVYKKIKKNPSTIILKSLTNGITKTNYNVK